MLRGRLRFLLLRWRRPRRAGETHGRTPVRALTVRRTAASCRATGRRRHRFWNVSNQHSNRTHANGVPNFWPAEKTLKTLEIQGNSVCGPSLVKSAAAGFPHPCNFAARPPHLCGTKAERGGPVVTRPPHPKGIVVRNHPPPEIAPGDAANHARHGRPVLHKVFWHRAGRISGVCRMVARPDKTGGRAKPAWQTAQAGPSQAYLPTGPTLRSLRADTVEPRPNSLRTGTRLRSVPNRQ